MLGLPPEALNAVLVHYALIPLRYTHPALALSVGLDPDNFWPFLTDAFLHGGWWHIIFNMWFLWIFGPAMEARFGRLGFLALYLGGAAAASAVHVATHPDSAEPVLGASGAIAAVIAAYALIYPTERVVTIVPIIFIPLFVPVPAMIFAAIWFVLQVMQGTQELGRPEIAAGVAWWAHIGGFAFGALFAVVARAPAACRTCGRVIVRIGDPPPSVVAVDALAPLVPLLRFDRERGDRPRLEAAQRDRLARLLAIAVGALVDPHQRLVDLGDQLALAIARAQLDRAIGLVLLLQMLERLPCLLQDFLLPGEQLGAKILALALVHERLFLRRTIRL